MASRVELQSRLSLQDYIAWRDEYERTGLVPFVQRAAMANLTCIVSNMLRGKKDKKAKPEDFMLPPKPDHRTIEEKMADKVEEFMDATKGID